MRPNLGSVQLAASAAWTLSGNDIGTMITAAPRLYPHMWSWDAAFIAIGLARLDTRRAAQELRTLFATQWPTGMVPHIVFNPGVPPGSYFPDAVRWDCVGVGTAPRPPANTSGLCQPPVHAVAVSRIWEAARSGREAPFARGFLRQIYPKLFT